MREATTTRAHRAATAALTSLAVVSIAVLVVVALQSPRSTVATGVEPAAAAQDTDGDDPTRLDDDGRFTGPGEVWPPQPKNATDVVTRDFGDLEAEPQAERLEQLDGQAPVARRPSEIVAADADVAAALGDDHNLIAVEATGGSTVLVYYSLSTNQTVEVTVTGDRIGGVTTYAAAEFQPDLSNDEKQAAVDLARAHWVAKGDPRIDSLQGFSILAFQADGSYHSTRMVYVSFHVDEDARPELLTWVDLSAGEVGKGEVER